eukprot:CAMPEP_0167761964 /NCGR_PEP_ID=MMETSP0110_2-20121227/12479_1 /TAXON_ID=629695 /ORGANISM="Gymnochlora sp., Strain CCMP2014" /LENGTH=639 /DNA_ID=CAMNT_0007648735 /DNA_START=54 /DNA_END=1973 /DNA_ORIENTATION=+
MAGLGNAPVDLPQLIVIGSQSAGKSSVLEKIVGRDFLPRGNTIVTRRPLILQLINTRIHKIGTDSKEWGEFLHKKGERIYNFTKIKDEIVRETERISGSNCGISSDPINLKIYSPTVLDLTLVDLPGITKVPVGDQPKDIETRIRNMAIRYISNKNSIMVAVSPANTDMANSESLKLARDIDPDGHRTLGVLTKIDLMDKGTNAWDMLNGKIIPLRHGYVGMVNRSQQDINNGKTVKQAIQDEGKFFRSHQAYRSIAHKLGTNYLTQRLNTILVEHIKKVLPSMSQKIVQQLQEKESKLRALGAPVPVNDKGGNMLNILLKFSKAFADAIDGKLTNLTQNDLCGGSRISDIFHNVFARSLKKIRPFDDLTDHQIRTAILNATATKPSLFVTEDSFQLLVKRQIARLKTPSMQCAELVYDELRRIAAQCETLTPELRRFPSLKLKVSDCARDLIRRKLEPTKTMIANLINIELSYVKTTHPNFISSSKAMALAKNQASQSEARQKSLLDGLTAGLSTIALANDDKLPPVPPVLRSQDIGNYEKGMSETRIIKTLIQSYFNIVQKIIKDSVPKAVMHFLVHGCRNSIQGELVKTLYQQTMFENLMAEEPHVQKERSELVKIISVLRTAVKVLKFVQDIQTE